MRYRKAKQRETDDIPVRETLTDRGREAERILGQSLDSARGEPSAPVTSFAILRTLVEARARRHAASKEISLMSAIKHPLTSHRKLSFGVVFAVLVFAFATLVPFEYQQTIGYQATFAGIDPSVVLDLERLENTLGALGYNDAQFGVHTSMTGVTCQVSGLPSRYAVREVTAAMASMADFQGEPEVEPLMETVSGSLYAQVKCEISGIDDFDFEGKTEEEIKAEIKERLAAQGCADAKVIVRTRDRSGDKEKREICIQVGDQSGASGAICSMAFSGASGATCSMGFLDGLDAEGKTDAELEEIIRKRCAENGQTDVEVEVTTRADGKRRIEIKCKPDE